MGAIKFDMSEMKAFQRKLGKMANEAALQRFCEDCAKDLARRLLNKAINRTPVGNYPEKSKKKGGKKNEKKGGTLRRGWMTKDNRDAKVRYADGNYVVELINAVDYAPYVEYGHRTRGHNGWVDGRLMMTISENEVRALAPALLEKKIADYMKEALHG